MLSLKSAFELMERDTDTFFVCNESLRHNTPEGITIPLFMMEGDEKGLFSRNPESGIWTISVGTETIGVGAFPQLFSVSSDSVEVAVYRGSRYMAVTYDKHGQSSFVVYRGEFFVRPDLPRSSNLTDCTVLYAAPEGLDMDKPTDEPELNDPTVGECFDLMIENCSDKYPTLALALTLAKNYPDPLHVANLGNILVPILEIKGFSGLDVVEENMGSLLEILSNKSFTDINQKMATLQLIQAMALNTYAIGDIYDHVNNHPKRKEAMIMLESKSHEQNPIGFRNDLMTLFGIEIDVRLTPTS